VKRQWAVTSRAVGIELRARFFSQGGQGYALADFIQVSHLCSLNFVNFVNLIIDFKCVPLSPFDKVKS
jgi:hypothetical protein